MDYEKAYKDALERARAGKPIDEVFPELKDERIRKEIIDYLSKELHNEKQLTPRTNEFEAWIAYLERQKEPRDYRKLYEEVVKSDWFKENYAGKSLGEDHQLAEWSEEDKLHLNNAILAAQKEWGAESCTVKFLKSLRPQPHWKPSEYTLSLVKKVANGEMLTRMEQMAMETLCNDLQKLL